MPTQQTKRLVFSKTRLESLSPPPSGRLYWYDEKTTGLALCITAAGARTFYLYRKVNGRPVRVRLGKFPETTIDQARDLAKPLNMAVASGQDPQEAKRARREEATFADLWAHWQAHSAGRKKASSVKEDARQYAAYLGEWKARRLSSIKRQDVAALHNRLGANSGAYQANRVLALVKSMFGKASDLGFQGENPARGIEKFPEVARDRFLMPEELPPFFTALVEEPNPFIQGFFMLALLTGARRRNLEAMRWDQISWELRQWRIPDTKGGFAVVVPLSPRALEVLTTLRQHEKHSDEWVFPSYHGAAHLRDPMPAWRRLLKRAGIEDLHIHDLRRSLGSWQAITGASLQIIGKSLGHVRPETTAIYSRLTLDPVRESVEKATVAMLAAGERKDESHEA